MSGIAEVDGGVPGWRTYYVSAAVATARIEAEGEVSDSLVVLPHERSYDLLSRREEGRDRVFPQTQQRARVECDELPGSRRRRGGQGPSCPKTAGAWTTATSDCPLIGGFETLTLP